MTELFDDLNPSPRLLMGPGPINSDPRVLRAMSMPTLGQFDPEFTRYMNETMALLGQLFQTRNCWSFLVNGSARAGIEAMLTSLITPGDRVLVPVFGRFGDLLCELARRCNADVRAIRVDWGTVFSPDQIEAAIREHRPKLVAVVHGETSTTMAQPLEEIGALCRRHDALLFVDATATLGGMPVKVDDWEIDAAAAGLQKCLSGPAGSAPVTLNDRAAEVVNRRKHIEQGLMPEGFRPGNGPVIQSNYFDVPMLLDYWSESRLNHHTESTPMLYAARECARIALQEGLPARFARHRLASSALIAGLEAMGLQLFGDRRHRMTNVTGIMIPEGIDGEAVRRDLLGNFGIEIGSAFGPLKGRIWRIGTMGYNCRRQMVLTCLAALEVTLRGHGFRPSNGAAVEMALRVYDEEKADAA